MGKTQQVPSTVLLTACRSGIPHHSGKLIYHLDKDVVFNCFYINSLTFWGASEFWLLSHSAKLHTKLNVTHELLFQLVSNMAAYVKGRDGTAVDQ